ncbi:MAG: hypothetical protein M5T52_21565 [Ignavibacteriaceae bacterium]|nr:hypothetical protein [Ignavibacteriaceae bacterium]
MKIVHLSTSDLAGGAAIACKRIVDAQALNGIDAKLLVQKKLVLILKSYQQQPKVYLNFIIKVEWYLMKDLYDFSLTRTEGDFLIQKLV